ncbi:serine/threonine-protein kinase-like protein CCR1 [Aristolochia californica]|uniref:serine/threonine-protein kinase-like protein CCR1 n=1 Tax=Aristolochia californica TaxID=171875 RepID=UPI0035D802A9
MRTMRSDFRSASLGLLFSLSLLLLSVVDLANAYGSEGPIAAAFGGRAGFFCAIEASGNQELLCWNRNGSSLSATLAFNSLPPMASLSGGEGFMCGLHALSSKPFCWRSINSGISLVPVVFRDTPYSHIASGRNHVCAVRGSYYLKSEDENFATVDCWAVGGKMAASGSYDPPQMNFTVGKIVAGDGFTCGEIRGGGFVCWGPDSSILGVSFVSETFVSLSSGRNSLCGISRVSHEVKCWGEIAVTGNSPLAGTRFVSLTAGSRHFCGIREDDHGIECWGSFNASSVPKSSGFLAISASEFTTCGVREEDLILDCWGEAGQSSNYNPPLQLSSPGICTTGRCSDGEFSFNASVLNVPDLVTLCTRGDLQVCAPCGTNCSDGFFPSSACSALANRVCTACSLCQNSSCWDICGLPSVEPEEAKQKQKLVKKLAIALAATIFGCFLLVLMGWCFIPRLIVARKEKGAASQCNFCVGSIEQEPENDETMEVPVSAVPNVAAQVFRLSELKDATNGFKEVNELGRGSYGFVYKATLPDGRQVAVKRANAATIIHSNSRDFEAELEILCKIRHGNLVNLLGYCADMGERLLVYEFMPHGTLHDHLHGGISALNWNLRLKIWMQAARGLLYLHKEAMPHIVHRNIKTSNILLDADWGARVADFGLSSSSDRMRDEEMVYVDPEYLKTQSFTEKSDVYSFGVILLEILGGRKAYDKDYDPPSITQWAVPLIRQGKAAALIDRNVELPRNVETLLRFAEIAELAVREDPNERPMTSDLVTWSEQVLKGGCW